MFNKKMITAVLVASMITTMGVTAFAKETNQIHNGGSEIIIENQGLVASEVDAVSISTFGITSGDVGSGSTKGYWIRGDKTISGVKNVYSSYKNYSMQGAASVTNGEGDYVDGGFKPKDTMSTANTKWTSSGTNKANYRYQ